MSKRICLLTPETVAYNPRLVKEADALHDAGYTVRVIACPLRRWVADHDAALVRYRSWSLQTISLVPQGARGRLRFWGARFRCALSRRVARHLTLNHGVAERALARQYDELVTLALREPADLFIAHNLATLPVAVRAAHHLGARAGFDSEDYHTGEQLPGQHDPLLQRIVEHIEAKHIAQCAYVTAPSDGIADALARKYGIRRPVVIHNVFPWGDRARLDGQVKDRRGAQLSLYWYSQTVGLDRGIQDAIRAAGLLTMPVQIHLRGLLSDHVRNELIAVAREAGVADSLIFHPVVHADELLSRASEHDVGLALEPGFSVNNALTTSNKIFMYMLAGIAIAASDVPGQRNVMASNPDVGLIYAPGDHQSLAVKLQALLDQPETLRAYRRAALAAAETRWNWEHESRRFVRMIGQLMEEQGALSCDHRRRLHAQ